MSEGGLFVVVNHTAARARAAWPRVRAALVGAGVEFEAHESTRQGETEERARAALERGCATVAAVGGDGTLSAAVSGFFEPCAGLNAGALPRAVNPEASLALLPAGTGDDFARGLSGGRRELLEAWVARLIGHMRGDSGAEGTFKRVDLISGSVGGGAHRFICLNAATLGIGAEVSARVSAQGDAVRRLPGEARFALAAVPRLLAWRNRRVRIIADGRAWEECDTNLLAVANGTYAGGGMNLLPEASLADGLLDVLAVCRISRPALLRELTRVHNGGHVKSPHVRLTRAAHVRVETTAPADSLGVEADGDVRGQTPAEFRVMPAALRVVC